MLIYTIQKFESNIKEFQYFSHKISSHRNGLGKENEDKDVKKESEREAKKKKMVLMKILKIIQGFDLRSPHQKQ